MKGIKRVAKIISQKLASLCVTVSTVGACHILSLHRSSQALLAAEYCRDNGTFARTLFLLYVFHLATRINHVDTEIQKKNKKYK